MSSKKVIVTIAPTGGAATKDQHPDLPITPEEIAADTHACYNAGASVVAIHARNPEDGSPTCNPDVYYDINDKIRAKCDIIINNSTGGGVFGDVVGETYEGNWEILWEERIKGMEAGAEMCTLDATTIIANLGDREVLMNTAPSRARFLAEEMKKRGIKPEWEVFSPTHIVQDTAQLIAEGLDDEPPFINLVMGVNAFQNAMPYTPKNLQFMVDLLPKNAIFGVSGIGPAQLPAAMNSLLLGGHVRVGLEDNFYYSRGKLATNLQLVERLVRLVREMGYEPATPAEAREIMGLPRAGLPKPKFAI